MASIMPRHRFARQTAGTIWQSGPSEANIGEMTPPPPTSDPVPTPSPSPGDRLRAAVEAERPLQVAGAINAYCALLAERAGFKAVYLSGAGVANASFGLPDR